VEDDELARHISALKRARQNKKRRLRNQSRKTRVKGVVREVRQALLQKDAAGAETALTKAAPIIAQVAGKGTLHWRAAARKISRLSRQVNALKSA
jgi:small subunit ribosomal protein S20